MGIVLTFVVNAGLNFALGLLVAMVLGPEAYGRFSVALTIALVINTAGFEWLRLGVTRFYSARSRAEDPSLRATLNLGYAAVSLSLAALTIAALALGVDVGLPAALLAGAALTGFANGLFEYQAALARARFLDAVYARLVAVKNGLAVCAMVGGAWLTRDPVWVIAGAALSAAAAVVPVWRALRDPDARLALADPARLRVLAAYGAPVVAANVAFQMALLATRGASASAHGFAEAGRLALATDIGLRLVATLGAALDVWLFQLAVRADERDGRAAAERQIMRNAVLVFTALCPLAAGYLALMPAFEALLVGDGFRGAYGSYSWILMPGLLAYGLVQFALNPVFQITRRTGAALTTALVALVVTGALLLGLPARLDPWVLAAAHAAGLVAAFLVGLWLAARLTSARPAWRDLAAVVGASGLMTAAVWPLRGIGPAPVSLALGTGVGAAIYAVLILACDVGGLRGLLLSRVRARPA
ncbi:lipopolysaccharide biosynthesis protein [Salinarimonas soli]|uniref:Lipopolysaccharide biosynthesis protein n=1 Tax=Salinarimonas soli TaxID=1638099 RepID=A0A5B2W247_9HYPH|nr:polysaccharide biosynthesis C-terminal domain-containing protein [Salinarimonas soli]KAA2244309.1 lipopolysaccharide biosynthesis protein [Salinarimonas soli]